VTERSDTPGSVVPCAPPASEEPTRRSRTIFQPEEPRPESFVAGTLYDLTALVQTTAALLRAGLVEAVVVMFVLTLLALVPLLPVLVDRDLCLPGLVMLGPLLVSGPLAVFSRLALGERLSLVRAIVLALRSTPFLVLCQMGYGTVVLYLVLMNALPVLILGDREGGVIFALCLVFTLPVSLFFMAELARSALTQVVWIAIADPKGQWAEFDALLARSERRRPIILCALGAPVAIVAASIPTPFAIDFVRRVLGASAEGPFLASVAVAGVTVAIFLGSALLAACYAVILGTPVEEAAPSSPASS